MIGVGKVVVMAGLVVVAVGLVLMVAGRAGLPLGRLPGDIVYRGKSTVFYFPLVTSILLSLVVTLVLWIVGRMNR